MKKMTTYKSFNTLITIILTLIKISILNYIVPLPLESNSGHKNLDRSFFLLQIFSVNPDLYTEHLPCPKHYAISIGA